MKINFIHICILGLVSLVTISCNSLKQPESIFEPIDYENYDVVQSEIERIRGFQQEECVRALWRSILLGQDEIKNECIEIVKKNFSEALENKDFYKAQSYYKSLKTIGFTFEKSDEEKYQKLYLQEVPGIRYLQGKNPKAPKSISDCMNATVTIWVDRGIKVQNGAGFADIVIGSGFFIDERGYLITNHHVIESMVDSKYEGFSRLYVKLLSDSDTKIPAKVIGYDSVLDLALLKVEVEPEFILSLGSSQDLGIGDKVSAIGTPIGLEGTLTAGIISSTDRKLTTLGKVFQIDAAINSGNSGGPLIDQNMRVQAIVFAGMLQFQGLNFAIPVEYLKQILPTLYNGGDGGRVLHSWIGAYGHTYRKGTKKAGVEVQYVMPGSSSFLAGLKPGDIIIEIDGCALNTIDDLQFYQLSNQTGTIANCKYLDAEGEEKQCYVYFDIRPDSPLLDIYKSDFLTTAFIPIFGMKLVPASSESRKVYKIENVIKGSVADEMSFSENDILTVHDVRFDNERKYFAAQIITQRRKKGYLDVSMVLSAAYDNPYYF